MQPLVLEGTASTVVVDPPVVLAPMAGVTNTAFRTMCRGFSDRARAQRPAADAASHGPLYVSEMVGARALVEGSRQGGLDVLATPDRAEEVGLSGGRLRTMLRAAFGEDEPVRSLQLYATDPDELREGVALLAAHDLVDHIDLNFGCPARKVTRHGGGAALPWRTDLFAALVGAAVDAAGGRPVTVKMRKGIDEAHLTYLDAGRIARDLGAAAVTLHGRTAEDAYAGTADWDAIARLVEAVGEEVPVLGNGDVWQGADAVAMVARTGCAGVVVGRGCLGRPWLFRDLDAALSGLQVPAPPTLGEVADMLAEHGRLLAEHLGEDAGMREIRKHTSWYLQGFAIGRPLRLALRQVTSLQELAALLGTVDPHAEMPESALAMHRGHTHGPKPVRLPQGWLDRRTDSAPLAAAAAAVVSGG